MKQGAVLKICQVIDVYDENDGDRIKVRLSPEDDKLTDDKIPFAFPLLPKHIHIKPKVGEMVLIILTKVGNGYSNRYYIGPIISQPQYLDEDSMLINALSLYPGSYKEPDVAPRTNVDSHGALANDKDVALYGRKKGDIILTDDDVRIRCGCRLKDKSVKGGVVFNRTDPAYIHLKHTDEKRGEGEQEYRSTATVVADNINLISSLSKDVFKTNDKKELITDNEMSKILEKAHVLPYGDILVDFLKLFLKAFAEHTHPYPGITPCATSDYIQATTYDLNKILSEHVRIN